MTEMTEMTEELGIGTRDDNNQVSSQIYVGLVRLLRINLL